MKDERKKRMVGTNMKPRGIQAENAEIVPEQPTAEGQPKSILEPVLSRNQAVETPYSLEAEKVQNLESPENPIVADAEAENGQIQPFVESELDTEKRLDIEDDLEKAMAQVMEPQTDGVTIFRKTPDGGYKETENVDPRKFVVGLSQGFTPDTPAEEVLGKNWKMKDMTSGIHISEVATFSSQEMETLEKAGNPLDIVMVSLAKLGPRPNGDCKFAVTVQEGYVNAVREWAEADGITPEEWLSNIITSNIETYAMPAKGR